MLLRQGAGGIWKEFIISYTFRYPRSNSHISPDEGTYAAITNTFTSITLAVT